MTFAAVYLIVLLALLAGVIALQCWLSRMDSKWPGLALPFIAFVFGLLYPLCMAAPPEGVSAGLIFQVLLVWLLGNIPTILLLALYFGCRGKRRRERQLEKMHIQDLS